MNHVEKAEDYYMHNFNCSQGVFTAFAKELGVDEKTGTEDRDKFRRRSKKG